MQRRSFIGAAAGLFAAACYPGRGGRPSAPPGTAAELQGMLGLPERRRLMLGYPVNMLTPPDEFFAWRRELARVGIDQFAFNNVGDPFEHSHIPFNTHSLERELIVRFAEIYRFPPDDVWGFLSNSGTDSNMHGLYMGRTILQARTGVLPTIYFTAEAHYSIEVLADLLGLERVYVGTHADGRMHEGELAERLAAAPERPALVVATIGTTFKGAVDSIDAIASVLAGREAYLHVDAALFGGYLPHTPHADELHQCVGNVERYHSIAVSCHKFFGFPSPAGIFMTTRSIFEEFLARFAGVHNPEYLLQIPGTITCSRDAVKPAEFHYFSTPAALNRQREHAEQILADTSWLLEQLLARVPALAPVRADPRSNTIYFRRPSDAVVETYSLATMDIDAVPHAHVVVMPHVTRELLDRFVAELESGHQVQR